MKFNKLSMLLLAGVLLFSFMSCTKNDEVKENEVVETEIMEKASNELEEALSVMGEESVEETTDILLDHYEKLVDEYIEVYKKIKEGTAVAGEELNKLVEQNQEIVTKIGAKAAEMTEEQRKRFEGLAAKLAEAAAN